MRSKFHSKHERSTSPNLVTVKAVRRITLENPVPVCDLTVPKYHNFALASGPYVHNCEKARSPHHEIIKLRGVGVNAQKAESGKTLGNREIKLIIKALGIKPGETDLSKMRTHDITILTDADQDGKHIASLLLAFFKVYYPELVRQGRIRYINGPLYMGQLRDTRKFGDTKEEVLAQFEAKSRNGVRLTRMKGWGEASGDQLAEIAFNPETRRIVTLTMDVDDEVRIGHIMGKDVEHRKDLLSNGVDDDAEEVA